MGFNGTSSTLTPEEYLKIIGRPFSRDEYIAAYHWFGWTKNKAEQMYDSGKRLDNLVQEYHRHFFRGKPLRNLPGKFHVTFRPNMK